MTRFASSAVVLGGEPSGESDRRVELLTPGQGRIWAQVKGGARSMKRFAGGFDLAQLMEVGFLTGGRTDRVLIEHASIVEPFAEFRHDPLRLARASALIEICRLTVPLHQPSERAFTLLVRGLSRLQAEPDSDRWVVVYGFLLLGWAGLTPELTCCTLCSKPAGKSRLAFSPSAGGLVCPPCREGDEGPPCLAVSPAVVKTLVTVLTTREDRLSRFKFSAAALRSARELLRHFCAHHLARPLRSLDFIDQLSRKD